MQLKTICASLILLSSFCLSPATYKVSGFPTYKVGDLVSSSTLAEYAQVAGIKHWEEISKLIWCESRWVNVVHLDNGAISRGILQFRDGIRGTSGLWKDIEQETGMTGTSTDPYQAIQFTDWALDKGLKSRWSCAKIMGI